MPIQLINHPFKDHEVGEVVDLGDEKNQSLVQLQRAIWVEDKPKKKRKKKRASKSKASEE